MGVGDAEATRHAPTPVKRDTRDVRGEYGIGRNDSHTVDGLTIPNTSRRRSDSFYRPLTSSDGERDDFVPSGWTPSKPLSGLLSPASTLGLTDHATGGAQLSSDPEESEYYGGRDSVLTSESESTPEKPTRDILLYTGNLGAPDYYQRRALSEFDVITDAGEQQQLRQKRPSFHQSEDDQFRFNIEESIASLPIAYPSQEFQSRILKALQKTRSNQSYDQEFLPKGELYRLVNQDAVVQELSRHLSSIGPLENIQKWARVVCSKTKVIHRGKEKIKTFRKIFALLVITELTSDIPSFIDEDLSDLDLPLTQIRSSGRFGLSRKNRLGRPSDRPLECFQHSQWSPIKIRNFEEYQWKMLSPYFAQGEDGDVKHYVLQDNHVLPFLLPEDREDNADRTGGFGKVFMVRIHEEHHGFLDKKLCSRGFAIKQQLYPSDRDAFKKEIAILKRFSGERSHKHIVSLLATYEQFRKFHLIFHRAEGDLFAYWNKINPKPTLTFVSIMWIAEQCTGVAEALLRLHRHLAFKRQPDMTGQAIHRLKDNKQSKRTDRHVTIADPLYSQMQSSDSLEQPTSPVTPDAPTLIGRDISRPPHPAHEGEESHAKKYGRHGDINPGNLLWFKDSGTDSDNLKGTLKLADFGQAELNTLLSRTQPRNVANTLTYRPPESDLLPKIVRQSYDIWCLGCVYLEFITWQLGGKALLSDFTLRRMTSDVLQNYDHTDTFFQVVRNREMDQMEPTIKKEVILFIDELHRHENCTDYLHEFLDIIQKEMLIVDSAGRASCDDICKSLRHIYEKCSNNEDYATKRSPWYIGRDTMPVSSEIRMSRDAQRVIENNLPVLASPRRLLRKIRGRNRFKFSRDISGDPL